MATEVRLLGSFAILADGKAVETIRTPRMQALYAYLTLHLGTAIPRSQLAYLFWPDSTEAQAHTNLRKALHNLKQVLPAGMELLETDSAGLRLSGPGLHVDTLDFATALAEADRARRANEPDVEESALETATALYHGELLPGCYDDWVLSDRDSLRAREVQALDRLSALLENRQHYRDAIRCAERLLECEPLREETYQRLMRLYALVGDRAAALHVYHRCITVLRQELGVDPTGETHAHYVRIMQLDAASFRPEMQGPAGDARLVARQPEWRQLQSAWRESLHGKAQLVLVSGEPGIGKTRLAEEMLEWARRQGIFTARATCYAAEGGLAFAPVAEWLSARPLPFLESHWLTEIARLLPETLGLRRDIRPPSPITEGWQRQHLFEALARGLLEGGQPILCFLDNLQWCDADTLQWLHFLLRFRPAARLLLLAAARPEEFETTSAGVDFLASLAANGQLVRIDLPRLDLSEAAELGRQLIGRAMTDGESAALFHETEGVPLFVVETLRAALGNRGPTSQPVSLGDHRLPAKVQAIILQRLNRLEAPSLQALEAAAVIGREFLLDALRSVSQLDESTLIRALDDLWRRRLINERGGAYDFSHDKVRDTVYAGMGMERRKWLHRRAADTLERLHAGQPDGVSAQIAAHLELAGEQQRAVGFYLEAACEARRVFALDEALKHVQRALTLNRQSQRLPELHELQGDMLAFKQQHEPAGVAYREALIACTQEDWLRRARLHRKYAAVFARVNNELAEQAIRLAENSLNHLQDKSAAYWQERIELYLNESENSYWRQNADEMTRLLEQLAPVIEGQGSLKQKAAYLNLLARRNFVRSRNNADDETIQLARQHLELQDSMGELAASAFGRQFLGFILFFGCQLDEAESCLREAWQMSCRTGDHRTLLIALCYLSLTHRLLGRLEEVKRDVEALRGALDKSSEVAYEGILRTHLAWLAYREGRSEKAAILAREAVSIWAAALHYPIQWPAWTVLLALAVEAGNVAEAEACLKQLVAPDVSALAGNIDSRLRADLDACSENPASTLVRCKGAVEALKKAGYL